jgi:hypothetical protein
VATEALGRVVNVIPTAASLLISVKDCSAILFVCTGNDTFTLYSAATYNGSTTALATITDYYTCTSATGAAKWVDATQAAASTVTCSSTSHAVAFDVDVQALPANAEYLEVGVGASGLVTAILHDLLVQRDPANMRVTTGSTS